MAPHLRQLHLATARAIVSVVTISLATLVARPIPAATGRPAERCTFRDGTRGTTPPKLLSNPLRQSPSIDVAPRYGSLWGGTALVTLICFGLAVSLVSRVSVSTPSSNFASAVSASTADGTVFTFTLETAQYRRLRFLPCLCYMRSLTRMPHR